MLVGGEGAEVWMGCGEKLSPREHDKEKETETRTVKKFLSCYVAAWYASWGASSDKAVAAADPCLPRAAVALSSFRACLFLEHAPHSPHSLTPLTPLTPLTLFPHQLLHINRLQPILRHLCSTSCHPPSHRTCPGFPVSVPHHSTRPQRAFHPGLGPLHSLPPRFADRPTHPAACSRSRYPSCGLPVLSSAICVFPFALR
jgi:hypothetical protein